MKGKGKGKAQAKVTVDFKVQDASVACGWPSMGIGGVSVTEQTTAKPEQQPFLRWEGEPSSGAGGHQCTVIRGSCSTLTPPRLPFQRRARSGPHTRTDHLEAALLPGPRQWGHTPVSPVLC